MGGRRGCGNRGVLLSRGCLHRALKTGWLRAAEMHYLMALSTAVRHGGAVRHRGAGRRGLPLAVLGENPYPSFSLPPVVSLSLRVFPLPSIFRPYRSFSVAISSLCMCPIGWEPKIISSFLTGLLHKGLISKSCPLPEGLGSELHTSYWGTGGHTSIRKK